MPPLVFAGEARRLTSDLGKVADGKAFLSLMGEINAIVHDCVAEYHGSISAEHGIGRIRRDELPRYKDPVELALMKKVRAALDPLGIMNPGKVF